MGKLKKDVFKISGTKTATSDAGNVQATNLNGVAIPFGDMQDPLTDLKSNISHLLGIGHTVQQDEGEFTKDINRCTQIIINGLPRYKSQDFAKLEERQLASRRELISVLESMKNNASNANLKKTASEKSPTISEETATDLLKALDEHQEQEKEDLRILKRKAIIDYKTINSDNDDVFQKHLYTLAQGTATPALLLIPKNYIVDGKKMDGVPFAYDSETIYERTGNIFSYKSTNKFYVMTCEDGNWVLDKNGKMVNIGFEVLVPDQIIEKGYQPFLESSCVSSIDMSNPNVPVASCTIEIESKSKFMKYVGPRKKADPAVLQQNISSGKGLENPFKKSPQSSKDDIGAAASSTSSYNIPFFHVLREKNPFQKKGVATSAKSGSPSSSPEETSKNSPSSSTTDVDSESDSDDDFTFLGNDSDEDEDTPKSSKKGKTKKK